MWESEYVKTSQPIPIVEAFIYHNLYKEVIFADSQYIFDKYQDNVFKKYSKYLWKEESFGNKFFFYWKSRGKRYILNPTRFICKK